MQAIGLDIKILNDKDQEIDLRELSSEENEPVSLERIDETQVEEIELPLEDLIAPSRDDENITEEQLFDTSSLFDEDF